MTRLKTAPPTIANPPRPPREAEGASGQRIAGAADDAGAATHPTEAARAIPATAIVDAYQQGERAATGGTGALTAGSTGQAKGGSLLDVLKAGQTQPKDGPEIETATIALTTDPACAEQQAQIVAALTSAGITDVEVILRRNSVDGNVHPLIIAPEGAPPEMFNRICAVMKERGYDSFLFPTEARIATPVAGSATPAAPEAEEGPATTGRKGGLRVGGSAHTEVDLTTRSGGYQHELRFGGSLGLEWGRASVEAKLELDRIGQDSPNLVVGGVFAGPLNAEAGAANSQHHEAFLYYKAFENDGHRLDLGVGARRWAVVSLGPGGGETRWGPGDQGTPGPDDPQPTIGYADGISPRLRYQGHGFKVDVTGTMIPIGNKRTLPYAEWEINVDKEVGRFNFGTHLEISGQGRRPNAGVVYASYEVLPDFLTAGMWAGRQQRPDWNLEPRDQVGIFLRIHTSDKLKLW